jgi:hypothetical protein
MALINTLWSTRNRCLNERDRCFFITFTASAALTNFIGSYSDFSSFPKKTAQIVPFVICWQGLKCENYYTI